MLKVISAFDLFQRLGLAFALLELLTDVGYFWKFTRLLNANSPS